MKKQATIVFLMIFIMAVVHGQDINYNFKLTLNNKELTSEYCFNKKSNYKSLAINCEKSFFDKILVSVILPNQNIKKEFELSEFNGLDIQVWLFKNDAFQKNNLISFKLLFINKTNITIKEKVYCLINSDVENDVLTPLSGNINIPDYVVIPINFATDRNYNPNLDVNEQFGSQRSNIKYGICKVSIPKIHEIGEIEAPSFWRFEFSEDSKKHIVLHESNILSKEFFFNQLSDNIRKSSRKSSFLFVHGYNVSFANAAKRTAQIAYDLRFDGEPVFYSWPSRAELTGYMADEANIKWAQTNIKNFLIDYLTKSEAEEIFLVAHSMGNRGLTRAIIDVITDNPQLKSKIKEIILAAPDIDADIFKRDIAPKMVSLIQKPITLYVSSDDLALEASKKVHGYPRIGDSGEGLILIDGIETIDASGIDTSFLSHSYFADTSSIILDIFNLIKTGKRASKRDKLKMIELRDQIYWRVIKD